VTPAALVDAALGAAVAPPATAEALLALYTYRVPFSTDDGACVASKELDPQPFDLARALLGAVPPTASHPVTVALQRLTALVQALAERTAVDWLGVYLRQTAADG
jgi:hypothetical protein